MDYQIPVNTLIFEVDGNPKKHWFVCKSIYKDDLINDENQQIVKFSSGPWNRALTWYKNFIEKDPRPYNKSKIIFYISSK